MLGRWWPDCGGWYAQVLSESQSVVRQTKNVWAADAWLVCDEWQKIERLASVIKFFIGKQKTKFIVSSNLKHERLRESARICRVSLPRSSPRLRR